MNHHVRAANSTHESGVRDGIAASFLDRPELSKEAANSQTCLHMLKLLKVIEVTCSILFLSWKTNGGIGRGIGGRMGLLGDRQCGVPLMG